MPLFGYILLSSFITSLVSFVGIFLVFDEEKVRKATHYIVSFAIGALLSVAFLDLLPEALEGGAPDKVLPFILAGIFLFFILEKFIFWYHCHDGKCQVHTYSYLILWGDFFHNFLDGVILALTFLVDVRLGLITTLAVILHEIPQEIGDYVILIHGGFTRTKALFYNFLSGLSSVLGAVFAWSLGKTIEPFLPLGLAMTAGGFIYLAMTDLLPELHESTGISHSILQTIFILIGAFLVIAPGFLFEH